MDRHLVINKDNIVVNVIAWNGTTNWSPPKDCYAVRSKTGNIGWIYDKETGLCYDPNLERLNDTNI